jgi:hypothetical protein
VFRSLDRHLRAAEEYKEQRRVAFTDHTAWTVTNITKSLNYYDVFLVLSVAKC